MWFIAVPDMVRDPAEANHRGRLRGKPLPVNFLGQRRDVAGDQGGSSTKPQRNTGIGAISDDNVTPRGRRWRNAPWA
jgi:hypothetical protein